MLLRGTRSDLEAIEERMHSVMPQVTQQLKAVIKEAESVLVSNKVRASMEAHVVDVLKNITVSEYSKEIKASWEQTLQNFRTEMETTLRQHLEAVEATMVESQQANVANVKKIVDSRTPSDTIVTLYNELDEARAKIEKLESSKDKSSHSQPISAKKRDLSNGITVATGIMGAVVGAGSMWLILIGFS